jgi:hypothetical protein
VKTEIKTTILYQLKVYPIKGVTETRALEIVKQARIPMDYEDEYNAARDAAREISDLGGIRRVDIIMLKTEVKVSLSGAYSMGVYMKDREDPKLDYHYKGSGVEPPVTRRVKKEIARARKNRP